MFSPRNVERKKRYFPLHERVKTASKNDENEMIKERRIKKSDITLINEYDTHF